MAKSKALTGSEVKGLMASVDRRVSISSYNKHGRRSHRSWGT